MNNLLLQQILAMAAAGYYDVLCVLFEMLHRFGTTLGLMVPGFAEQLAINNGVGVTANGQPIYCAVVLRRNGREVQSIRALRAAVQDALDEVCYGFCIPRLCVVSARYLPDGFVGLVLTW